MKWLNIKINLFFIFNKVKVSHNDIKDLGIITN